MEPGSRLDKTLTTATLVVGLAAIGYGVSLVYWPAVWIYVGLLCVFPAIAARPDTRPRSRK